MNKETIRSHPIYEQVLNSLSQFKTLFLTTFKSNFPATVIDSRDLAIANERFTLLLLLFAQTLTGLIKGDQENDILKLIGLEEGVRKHFEEKFLKKEEVHLETLNYFDSTLQRMATPSLLSILQDDTVREIEKVQRTFGKYGIMDFNQTQRFLKRTRANARKEEGSLENNGQNKVTELFGEIQEMRKQAEGKEAVMLKTVEGYLNELVVMKEMMGLYHSGKITKEELYDVKYFDPVECLDEDMRKILNHRLKEMEEFYASRIQRFQHKILTLGLMQLNGAQSGNKAIKPVSQTIDSGKKEDILVIEKKPEVVAQTLGEICNNSMKKVFDALCDALGQSWLWPVLTTTEGLSIKNLHLKKFICNHSYHKEDLEEFKKAADEQLLAIVERTAEELKSLREDNIRLGIEKKSISDAFSRVEMDVRLSEADKIKTLVTSAVQAKENQWKNKVESIEEIKERLYRTISMDYDRRNNTYSMQKKLAFTEWRYVSKMVMLTAFLEKSKSDYLPMIVSKQLSTIILTESQVAQKAGQSSDALMKRNSALEVENMNLASEVFQKVHLIENLEQGITKLQIHLDQMSEEKAQIQRELGLAKTHFALLEKALRHVLRSAGVTWENIDSCMGNMLSPNENDPELKANEKHCLNLPNLLSLGQAEDNLKLNSILQIYRNSMISMNLLFSEKMVEKSCNTNIAGVKTIITATSEAVGSLQIEIEKRKKLLVRENTTQTYESRVPRFLKDSRLIVFREFAVQVNIKGYLHYEGEFSRATQTESSKTPPGGSNVVIRRATQGFSSMDFGARRQSNLTGFPKREPRRETRQMGLEELRSLQKASVGGGGNSISSAKITASTKQRNSMSFSAEPKSNKKNLNTSPIQPFTPILEEEEEFEKGQNKKSIVSRRSTIKSHFGKEESGFKDKHSGNQKEDDSTKEVYREIGEKPREKERETLEKENHNPTKREEGYSEASPIPKEDKKGSSDTQPKEEEVLETSKQETEMNKNGADSHNNLQTGTGNPNRKQTLEPEAKSLSNQSNLETLSFDGNYSSRPNTKESSQRKESSHPKSRNQKKPIISSSKTNQNKSSLPSQSPQKKTNQNEIPMPFHETQSISGVLSFDSYTNHDGTRKNASSSKKKQIDKFKLKAENLVSGIQELNLSFGPKQLQKFRKHPFDFQGGAQMSSAPPYSSAAPSRPRTTPGLERPFGQSNSVRKQLESAPATDDNSVFGRLWSDVRVRKDNYLTRKLEQMKQAAFEWEEQMKDNLEKWVGQGNLVEDESGFVYLRVKLPNEEVVEVPAYFFEGAMMIEMVDMLKVCQEISLKFVQKQKERIEAALLEQPKKVVEVQRVHLYTPPLMGGARNHTRRHKRGKTADSWRQIPLLEGTQLFRNEQGSFGDRVKTTEDPDQPNFLFMEGNDGSVCYSPKFMEIQD